MESVRESMPELADEVPSSLLTERVEPDLGSLGSAASGLDLTAFLATADTQTGKEKKKKAPTRKKGPSKPSGEKRPALPVETSVALLKEILPSKKDHEQIELMAEDGDVDRLSRHAQIYAGIQKDSDYIAQSDDRCIVDLLYDDQLAAKVGGFRGTHTTMKSPGDAIDEVMLHVNVQIPKDKQGRKDAYHGVNAAPLGKLVDEGTTMCREKAIYAQVLLAGYGIATTIVSASRPGAGEGEMDGRHTWLETPQGSVIDTMWGQVGRRGTTTHRDIYTEKVARQTVVKPVAPLIDEEVEKGILLASRK